MFPSLKYSILISAFAVLSIPTIVGENTGSTDLKTVSASPVLPSPASTGGIENIIVETYYISDTKDNTDVNGGTLAVGSTTYRIYVDMASGYQLQAIYGSPLHPCYITTSTVFFNNQDRGTTLGSQINKNYLKSNTVPLDSWLTMGAATSGHLGVLKTADTDGSVVGGTHSDGGSANIAGGILVNNNGAAGIPLTTEDGLLASTAIQQPNILNLDLSPFDIGNTTPTFTTNNGSISSFTPIVGPTTANQVLIAQITTTGTLTFQLNLQILAPDGVTVLNYVAANPQGTEILFPGLTH